MEMVVFVSCHLVYSCENHKKVKIRAFEASDSEDDEMEEGSDDDEKMTANEFNQKIAEYLGYNDSFSKFQTN